MREKIFNLQWMLPFMIFALFLVACQSETPGAIQTLPAQPEATVPSETEIPAEVP